MDKELKQALEFSNYSVTLNNQKRLIKEKYKENLILYYAGGRFTAKTELITFIDTLLHRNIESVILVDDNDNPFKIENLSEFFDNVLQQYTEATNLYYEQLTKLSKQRSVGGLVEV